MAPGQLAFNADQDRPLPYLLYNVVKSVAMYTMAMRRGIATRTFIKDTATPGMLLSSLKTLVGDSSHGEGLAPGQLAFIADQDRPLPYLLYNVVKSGGTIWERPGGTVRGPRVRDSICSPCVGYLGSAVTEAVLSEFFKSVGPSSYSCRLCRLHIRSADGTDT